MNGKFVLVIEHFYFSFLRTTLISKLKTPWKIEILKKGKNFLFTILPAFFACLVNAGPAFSFCSQPHNYIARSAKRKEKGDGTGHQILSPNSCWDRVWHIERRVGINICGRKGTEAGSGGGRGGSGMQAWQILSKSQMEWLGLYAPPQSLDVGTPGRLCSWERRLSAGEADPEDTACLLWLFLLPCFIFCLMVFLTELSISVKLQLYKIQN